MKTDRLSCVVVAIAAATAAPTFARAQDAGPVALLLPVSATTASQGGAGVALRDDYAIFANPAMINTVSGIGLTVGQYAADARSIAFVSGATVGPATLGWGVHVVDFSTQAIGSPEYPFVPATLIFEGNTDVTSAVAVIGGQSTWKRFRIGLAAKYAEDVGRAIPASALVLVLSRGSAFLADVGVSHALWTGTAGLTIQNIGHPYRLGDQRYAVPTQAALGWTVGHQWGPLDLSYATQVLARRGGWISPGGGVEVGWSWIEGYSVAGRIGARRPETDEERPVELGASFNADRLSIDYGVTLFRGNTAAHFVSLRWK